MLKRFFALAAFSSAALLSASGAGAAIISFDLSNASTGMTATDVAGAPGVRTGNYNNIPIASTSTATTLTTVVDNAGATVPGSTLTFTPGVGAGALPGGAGSTNDGRLFSNFYDQFGTPASTISVTGIPYAEYDVYFYRNAVESNANLRAGEFTIGAVSKYVRGGLTNPDANGNGYVLSNDTTNTGANITQGNYVVFRGLSGATLNASIAGVSAGDSIQRNKVVGFQIVEVPEPAALGLLATGGLLLLRRRSRAAR